MFEEILRMSVSASLIVAMLLIFRPMLKKLPGVMRSALWILVAIRLICPVFMESSFSLVPAESVIDRGSIEEQQAPPMAEVIKPDVFGETTVTVPSSPVTDTPEPEQSKSVSPMAVASNLWLAGMAAMIAYFVFEYARLKRRVAPSVTIGKGIRLCDEINTAFIVGVIKPVIYLPSDLDSEYRDMIINHERTHISRCDHLQKIVGYMLLALHWFNPFAWIAYVLFCKDIELACDEKVIKNRSDSYKKLYATALLYCCASKADISPCRVAFGEISVAQRIKNVLKYKGAKLWLLILGVVLAAVLCLCFLTNPKSNGEAASGDSSTDSAETENSGLDASADNDYSSSASVDASADKEESTIPPEDNSSVPPEDNSSVPPEDNSSVPPEDNSSVPPEDNSSVPPEDNSSVPPEDNSSVPPEDNSSVPPEDNSSVPPEDNGSVPPEGNGSVPPEDDSSVPPEDDSSEETKEPPIEWQSVQASHKTSESVNMQSQASRFSTDANRKVAYVKVNEYFFDEPGGYDGPGLTVSPFTEQRVKVWLCDKNGNKIDYVYTNSNGIAKFEVLEGEYTVVAEPINGYIQKQASFLHCLPPDCEYTLYELGGAVTEIGMYSIMSYTLMTITVVDSETKQPVPYATVYAEGKEYNLDHTGILSFIVDKSKSSIGIVSVKAEGYIRCNVYADVSADELVIELERQRN